MNDRPLEPQPEKTGVYETFGNLGLLRLVQQVLPAGGSVLDIGCASGGLLAQLAPTAGRRVGIEPDQSAAQAAARHADTVHAGTLAEIGDSLVGDGEHFDVVVLADVLEHVADPTTELRRAAALVAATGSMVISLPNVAHWTMRLHLGAGRWRYGPSGILDDTHLRFFTWHSAAALVRDSGLQVRSHIGVVPRLANHLPVPVPSMVEAYWQRGGRRWPNFFAYQQLLVVSLPEGYSSGR